VPWPARKDAAPRPVRRPVVPMGGGPPPGGGGLFAPPFPPWGIWEALLVLALFTVSQVAAALAIGALASTLVPAADHQAPLLVRFAVPSGLVVSHTVGWLAASWLVTRRHGLSFADGLRLRAVGARLLVRALLAGMGFQILVMAVEVQVPPPPDFSSPIEMFLEAGAWALALLFVVAIVMAPLLEEVLFRGLLFPALRRRFRFSTAAVAVSLLFTALHVTQTGTYWPAIAGIALCGFLLAWWRERTGSLWPPVAFHAGFNLTAFLPLLLAQPP